VPLGELGLALLSAYLAHSQQGDITTLILSLGLCTGLIISYLPQVSLAASVCRPNRGQTQKLTLKALSDHISEVI
jgi:hypothetical protein